MKKLCILLALLLTLSALGACRRTVPEETTTGTTKAEPTTIDPALIAAYDPIIDEFARLATENPDDYDAWEALGFNEPPREAAEGSLGYAVKDINGDGIPELLLLEKGSWGAGAEGTAMCALYTLQNRKPVLIGQYWSRSRGHLGADGRLFTAGSSSAFTAYLDSYELKPGAGELTHMTEYYMDVGNRGEPCWVMVSNGEEEAITEKQFNTLVGLYEKPARLMKFDFISVN